MLWSNNLCLGHLKGSLSSCYKTPHVSPDFLVKINDILLFI